ncbi:MAG: hypothetical protein WC468_01370 [Candidatus Paceibacterota bacterium]
MPNINRQTIDTKNITTDKAVIIKVGMASGVVNSRQYMKMATKARM